MTETIEVKERPILFSGEMINAILQDRKGMTRRVMRPQPVFQPMYNDYRLPSGDRFAYKSGELFDENSTLQRCPYGKPSDQLYVREMWQAKTSVIDDGDFGDAYWDEVPKPFRQRSRFPFLTYAAGMSVYHRTDGLERLPHDSHGHIAEGVPRWKPSIHMPRWASRIQLEVTGVRVERLNEISEADAIAEGLVSWDGHGQRYYGIRLADVWETDPRKTFARLWDSINAKRGFGWDSNCWVWVIEFRRIERVA